MLRIDQAGKGLRIALLAHLPIGRPAKLSPSRRVTGLGHAREPVTGLGPAREPEINAIGQYRSEESLPILGRRLGAEMQELITPTRPLIELSSASSPLIDLPLAWNCSACVRSDFLNSCPTRGSNILSASSVSVALSSSPRAVSVA